MNKYSKIIFVNEQRKILLNVRLANKNLQIYSTFICPKIDKIFIYQFKISLLIQKIKNEQKWRRRKVYKNRTELQAGTELMYYSKDIKRIHTVLKMFHQLLIEDEVSYWVNLTISIMSDINTTWINLHIHLHAHSNYETSTVHYIKFTDHTCFVFHHLRFRPTVKHLQFSTSNSQTSHGLSSTILDSAQTTYINEYMFTLCSTNRTTLRIH